MNKISPEIKLEAKKEIPEETLFNEIFQESQQIAKETAYIERRKNFNRNQKRKFNKRIEKHYLKPLRDRLIKESPDKAQMIAILVNLGRSCDWQYLTTHLIARNTNEKFAKDFWQYYDKISQLFYPVNSIKQIKSGVIGQIGIFKALEKIGLSPDLATPSQDALEGIDLFVLQKKAIDSALPIQIKHGRRYKKKGHERRLKKFEVIPEEKICFPSVNIESEKSQTHIFSSDFENIPHVEQSTESRAKEVNKVVKSLKILCPLGSFNPDTGEPTPEFLAKIEPEIKKYFPKSEKPYANQS